MRRILVGFVALALISAASTFANSDGDKSKDASAKSGNILSTGVSVRSTKKKSVTLGNNDSSSATDISDSAAPAAAAKPETVAPATELQKLRILIQAQQQQLTEQREALDDQQREINALQGQRRDGSVSPAPVTPKSGTNSASVSASAADVAESISAEKKAATSNESSSWTANTSAADSAATAAEPRATAPTPATVASSKAAQGDQANQSPLFFKIGGADFTPLGFLDFTSVYRSTDVGSGIGTGFGGIPFNASSPAGRLSETRFSAQNSRVGIKVDANPTDNFKITGYLEADFLGNAPGNLEVTSHSSTMRMRLYWVDVHRGKWEVLGGQSWSMMTPNRTGISPMPGDIFFSQDMDTNYQVGLVWLRTPGFRIVYHANSNWTLGFALEDPEQYTGGLVTFPVGFNSSQVDDTGGNAKTPNIGPDVIAKIAYDTKLSDHAFHIEASGLYRAFRLNTASTNANVTKSGGGGSVNVNFEVIKNLHLIANSFWSDGGGRYIFGLAPDFVVTTNSAGNFVPSPLHAGSGIAGFEYQYTPQTMLYGYYGGAYFGRRFQATTGTGGTTTFTGYGFPGSGSAQNRTIQEATFGVTETLWKNVKYGDLKIITQGSYLSRNPWSSTAAPGNAKSAHLGMAFVDLRYDLP